MNAILFHMHKTCLRGEQMCHICPKTRVNPAAGHLTRAEAVGADGPFGVVWAEVTLFPLLLRELWVRQGGGFVFGSEGMQHQARDAAAGTSALRRLLFLLKINPIFHFLCFFFSPSKHSVWKQENSPRILGMDPLCFTWGFWLIIKHKSRISQLQMWQHLDVAPNVPGKQGPSVRSH